MPDKVICQYRVTRGKEGAFEELLSKHWPTLHRLGLVTDDPSTHYRVLEQDNGEPNMEFPHVVLFSG